MTTQQPEALRLADKWQRKAQREADQRNSAYDHYGMGNTPKTTDPLGAKMAAELRRQHARIAELEAQLSAIGAGGVSGPLMGYASIAASAGSEP